MEHKIIIAIDGHSSCGKSTLAKNLAKELSYIYLDTGAMYRAVTYYFLQKNKIQNRQLDTQDLEEDLEKISVRFQKKGESITTILNGEDVESIIRGMEVSQYVSEVSQYALIRKKMVALQQEIGKEKGIILDGRDIGTVVFPQAEIKFFVTASAEIRAERRYLELQQKGEKVSKEEVLKNVLERDFQDENRKESPLRKAQDAILLDNTTLNKKQQLDYALNYIKEKYPRL